ncbi:MAG: hypothetical protein ACJAUW_001738, partial [Yoonia sp.]
GPVRSAVAGGRWLAHAACITAWIHVVNPQQSELCNNAVLTANNNNYFCGSAVLHTANLALGGDTT